MDRLMATTILPSALTGEQRDIFGDVARMMEIASSGICIDPSCTTSAPNCALAWRHVGGADNFVQETNPPRPRRKRRLLHAPWQPDRLCQTEVHQNICQIIVFSATTFPLLHLPVSGEKDYAETPDVNARKQFRRFF